MSYLFLLFWIFMICSRPWQLEAVDLNISVVDAETAEAIPFRVYVYNGNGESFFPDPGSDSDSVVIYDKVNWIRSDAFEKHATVTDESCVFHLEPGDYQCVVERGKEYIPQRWGLRLRTGSDPVNLRVPLQRFVDMAELGWYSGETHIHRELKDLPNLILTEDLNVALPLTHWVTQGGLPPTRGNKNQSEIGSVEVVKVDANHVIWPLNTEYEIFQVRRKSHTLGALFVLNHKKPLELGAPPWRAIADEALRQGALMDMDKLDWPFAMTLPVVTGATLYELANNHMWRTEFAFKDWNTESEDFLNPPSGLKAGGEKEWIHYTLGMYYTLLNAGFNMVPAAGTASGVHPVPVGFGRVYVHLDDGFSYDAWIEGLAAGRSMVTTGPILLVKVNGQFPGNLGQLQPGMTLNIQGTILSPVSNFKVELVDHLWNVREIPIQVEQSSNGGWRAEFSGDYEIQDTGWLALRCFSETKDERIRFAHSAPWKFQVNQEPLKISEMEKNYLIRRVKDEMARSKSLMDIVSWKEYQTALEHYQNLPVHKRN